MTHKDDIPVGDPCPDCHHESCTCVDLDDSECATCLGVGRLRDSETNELRKCLDCNGSGK